MLAGLAVWAAVLRIKPRYVGWVVAGVIVYTLCWAGFRGAAWYFGRFVVTNKRLMSAEGVLIRRVQMMPLGRVTDMNYVQSPLGRLLGYGTFQLASAGWRGAMRRIKDLPNPNELYLRIVEEMYEPEAVEARLTPVAPEPPGPEPDADSVSRAQLDPATIQLAIVDHLSALSAQLVALTAAIRRLDPTRDPVVTPTRPDPVVTPTRPDPVVTPTRPDPAAPRSGR